MFAKAIQEVGGFTRPIHNITKTYGNIGVLATSSTLFFVNDKGDAVTTRHVAEDLIRRQSVEENYRAFRSRVRDTEGIKGRRAAIRQIEDEAGFTQGVVTHTKTRFIDCFERITAITFHLHPVYDLAIIQFKWDGAKLYEGHAVFAESREYTQPGDYLCRLGFPFSEYDDYRYVGAEDVLEWTAEGRVAAPRFPLDGMVTRFLAGPQGLYGIEMSTPGFAGQAGGPLFDEDSVVCGMQFSTKTLHLGYDFEELPVIERGSEKKVSERPFLHVGQCIDAEVIKAFLSEHKVEHYVDL